MTVLSIILTISSGDLACRPYETGFQNQQQTQSVVFYMVRLPRAAHFPKNGFCHLKDLGSL
jgi:hypothetical protein